MKKYDVIVVGGGAAGMMAAISAAKEGAQVALIEKNEKLGKKNIYYRKRTLQPHKLMQRRGVSG